MTTVNTAWVRKLMSRWVRTDPAASRSETTRSRSARSVAAIATDRASGRLLPLAIAVAADHPDRPRTLGPCPRPDLNSM